MNVRTPNGEVEDKYLDMNASCMFLSSLSSPMTSFEGDLHLQYANSGHDEACIDPKLALWQEFFGKNPQKYRYWTQI